MICCVGIFAPSMHWLCWCVDIVSWSLLYHARCGCMKEHGDSRRSEAWACYTSWKGRFNARLHGRSGARSSGDATLSFSEEDWLKGLIIATFPRQTFSVLTTEYAIPKYRCGIYREKLASFKCHDDRNFTLTTVNISHSFPMLIVINYAKITTTLVLSLVNGTMVLEVRIPDLR